MEQDAYRIIEEHKSKGYKYLGWVNTNEQAQKAYRNSKQREIIEFGRGLSVVLLHDTKQIVEIDSGD